MIPVPSNERDIICLRNIRENMGVEGNKMPGQENVKRDLLTRVKKSGLRKRKRRGLEPQMNTDKHR
jgi:hypothetical protein